MSSVIAGFANTKTTHTAGGCFKSLANLALIIAISWCVRGIGGLTMSRRIKHKCPFCGEWVEHYDDCNGFCICFSKYYSQDDVWLNRKNGETRKGTCCLEVIEEGRQ